MLYIYIYIYNTYIITGSMYFVKMSDFSVYSSTVQIVVETGLSYIIAHLINDVIMVMVRC